MAKKSKKKVTSTKLENESDDEGKNNDYEQVRSMLICAPELQIQFIERKTVLNKTIS